MVSLSPDHPRTWLSRDSRRSQVKRHHHFKPPGLIQRLRNENNFAKCPFPEPRLKGLGLKFGDDDNTDVLLQEIIQEAEKCFVYPDSQDEETANPAEVAKKSTGLYAILLGVCEQLTDDH